MKKKVFLIVNVSLFIFTIFISKLNSAPIDYPTYPAGPNDLHVGVYAGPLRVGGGDGIGVQSTAEAPTPVGLVWINAGLYCQSGAGTSIPIATPLPLSGYLRLKTGGNDVLVLVSDLFLSATSYLSIGGDIETKYGRIVLDGEFNLGAQTMTFPTSTWPGKINGNGNALNFNSGGGLEHIGGSIELENVYLKGIKAGSIILTDRSKDLVLKNCVIQLDGDFVADFNLDIHGDVFVTGAGHTLCVNRYLNIQEGARLTMDLGTTFSMGYPASINSSSRGILHFNGCDIEIGDNYGLDESVSDGFFMKNGLVVFENRVRINDDSNSKTFTVGEDCDMKILGGARIILDGTTTFSVL